jgi:hypothetical protein
MRCTIHHVSISNSLANFVSQISLFANSQNNMGRKKRSHLQQFGKFCFQKPQNPLTKRKDPLNERRAPLSERRAPLSTRKLRCAAGTARAYMRAIDRDLPTCQRCQTQIPNYWRSIFLILSKILGCQTYIPNSWRCSINDDLESKFKKSSRRRFKVVERDRP